MSQWTNKYAISRDLSMVQGVVPGAIDGIVGVGDKPPALDFAEETEEEFFHHCIGEGGCSTAPDLSLIKQMLDIVRERNASSEDEQETELIGVIGKLTPNPVVQMPLVETTKKPNTEPIAQLNTTRRSRNVAVASILKAIEDKNAEANDQIAIDDAPKLLKPNDFMSNDANIVESVDKVNGWLEAQTISPIKPSVVATVPVNMFKKKVPVKKADKTDENKSPKVNVKHNIEVYKPSELADEYYKKYQERIKLKEAVEEDIWTKAQKKMKEIESKRKQEADQSPSSSTQEVDRTENLDPLDVVRLPQHRHLLTGECVVCDTMTKRGLNVDID